MVQHMDKLHGSAGFVVRAIVAFQQQLCQRGEEDATDNKVGRSFVVNVGGDKGFGFG